MRVHGSLDPGAERNPDLHELGLLPVERALGERGVAQPLVGLGDPGVVTGEAAVRGRQLLLHGRFLLLG